MLIRYLRVAVKTHRALLHVIGNLIRMAAPRAVGVRGLFNVRRRTNSSDLRELAFAKL